MEEELISPFYSTSRLSLPLTRALGSTSTKSVGPFAFPRLKTATDLSLAAFQPVINAQGSDEQQAIWMPKCLNHEILGCYLQTELGHGSNVQRALLPPLCRRRSLTCCC